MQNLLFTESVYLAWFKTYGPLKLAMKMPGFTQSAKDTPIASPHKKMLGGETMTTIF